MTKTPFASDPVAQATFVALAEQGFTRAEACRKVNVSPPTVRALIKIGLDEHGQPLDGTFAAALKEVEIACIEEAESQLFKSVRNGEPWAIQMYLKGMAKDRWADKPAPTVAIQINAGDGTPDERRKGVSDLAARLDARMAVLDVEAVASRVEDRMAVLDVEAVELPELQAGPE